MCGIAGYVGLDIAPPEREALVGRMCDAIRHRGPDDSGVYADACAGLGMRRLSIIDIAGGHQPMTSADGRLQLVYNGELYNYRELRQELEQRGHRFRTQSDSEVLLQQVATGGTEALQRLNGMFAFALWDAERRQLLLARDRMGVKPLYYHWDGKRLLFASEIKALLASGLVKAEIDPLALWDYLTFRYVPPPATIWKGIAKLPAGHFLTFSSGAPPVVRRWWDIPYSDRPAPADDRVQDSRFRELFVDAVRLRLIADVPVGVLLSGGLDSSAVAAAAKAGGARLETFSIGFGGDGPNELPYARSVARHLGAEHHEIVIGEREFTDFLDDFVRFTDEPLADPASIPLYYVCRLAAGRVKVVLSGEGSDEILGGYDFDLWVAEWQRQSAAMAPMASGGGWGARLQRLLRASSPSAPAIDLRAAPIPPNMTNYMGSEEKRVLLGRADALRDSMDVVREDLARVGTAPTLHQLLYVFSQAWLTEDLLMKADKMSMANSIELRTPFLDYRLVEWAARAAPEAKVGPDENGRLTTKRVLRRFCRGVLPDDIIERPKQGFPVPLFDWLTGSLKGYATELLLGTDSRSRSFLDRAELGRRVTLGTGDGAAVLDRHRLWNLMVLELWLRAWRAA